MCSSDLSKPWRTAVRSWVLAVSLAILGVAARADYTYVVVGNTVTITGYTEAPSALAIPEVLEGFPVTQIDTGAFLDLRNWFSFWVPGTIGGIGDFAFAGMVDMETIYFLGDAPTLLGNQAFLNATNATVYHLPWTAGWGPTFGGQIGRAHV